MRNNIQFITTAMMAMSMMCMCMRSMMQMFDNVRQNSAGSSYY